MNDNSCPEDFLAAYADWLSGRHPTFGQHIKGCSGCSAQVEKLERNDRFAQELRSAYAAAGQIDAAIRERLLSICLREKTDSRST